MLGAHGEYTAAMQEAIRLSMQPGMLDMNAEETASFIAAHRETINQGVSDALAKGMNEIPPEVVFTFADLPKAIYLRNLVLQRRMSHEGLEGGDQKIVRLTMSRPEHVDRIRKKGKVAVCNFFLAASGQVTAAVVQNLNDDRPLGFAQMSVVDNARATGFREALSTYVNQLTRGRLDWGLQKELLEPFGTSLISLFARVEKPEQLVLIPHGWLHVLPLHAASIDVNGQEICIQEMIRSVVYASSFHEYIYGGVINPTQFSATTKPKVLALVDTTAAELEWISVELDHYRVLSEVGWEVDVSQPGQTLPSDFSRYISVVFSGHAKSDPSSWAGSYLHFGGEKVTSHSIATQLFFSGAPCVTLAGCETSTNISVQFDIDHYCGLDLAFRIAGAACVFGTLWKVNDPLASLASVTLFDWVWTHGVSPGESLVRFARGLRVGDWKRWMLSDEQLNTLTPSLRRLVKARRERFDGLNADAFRGRECWTVFRCFGG